MARIINGTYVGNKNIRLVHDLSGIELTTDLAPELGGKGISFSPTDLLAGAIGSCMATLAGIVAERDGIRFTGGTVSVQKKVDYHDAAAGANPKIEGFSIAFHLPKSLTENERRKLEAAAHSCPVKKALKPEVEVATEFIYDL
jgi:putative redox protein